MVKLNIKTKGLTEECLPKSISSHKRTPLKLWRNHYLKKTTEQKTNKDNYINSHEIKIGDITYTVVSHFDDRSNETAEEKIERLISRDIKLY
ncbi:MAG: hypothetical protein E7494_14040 [Ruminococcus albus]|nr:hypothetical protein [Ruminococcus albus]